MNNKLMIKILVTVTVVLVFSSLVSAQTIPFTSYNTYEYNFYGESTPAPVGYTPTGVHTGFSIGVGDLVDPREIFFAEDRTIYILDAGSTDLDDARIIVLDETFKLIKIINRAKFNGEEIMLNGAQGLYVYKDGTMYITDTINKRILVGDTDGNISQVYTKPDTDLIPEDKEFNVTKVIRDDNNIIYALVNGVNEGAVTFGTDGSFKGFYASNQVARTAEVLLDFIWKRFMTAEQIRRSKSNMPSEFTNFDIDDKGFIYTVTSTARNSENLRKLNFKGTNLFALKKYGDLEWDRKLKEGNYTKFIDIDVDEDGYVNAVDSTYKRIFQYSQEGDLIAVFGGPGSSAGSLRNPISVESFNGKVYVLDTDLKNITEYTPTDYVLAVKSALQLFENGQYVESLDHWNRVLAMNSNSELAHYGIGRALDESGRFDEALKHFKLSFSRKSYSDAYKEARKDIIRDNFTVIIIALVAVIVGIILGSRYLIRKYGRKSEYDRSIFERKFVFPLYTMLHPVDGFDQLKTMRLGSYRVAIVILITFFVGQSIAYFLTGFHFNMNRAVDFNILIVLLQAFGVIIVWTISNWLVCTLFEGKGRIKDIFTMTAYSLLPFVISVYVTILMSNLFVIEEASFLTFIGQAGVWWTVILMFIGLSKVHQFTFKKTFVSVLGTFFALAVIIFLSIMFFGLMKQLYSFGQSIYSELQLMSVT